MTTEVHRSQPSAALQAFVRRVRLEALDGVARENVRLLREMNAPLLRLFAEVPEEALLAQVRDRLERLLTDLETGQALEATLDTLRRWEADELTGVPRHAVEPEDMVLVYAAQKRALLGLVAHYAESAEAAMAVVLELEAYYVENQTRSLQVFTRLREEAAAQRHLAASLIENLPCIFAYVDTELRFVQINRVHAALNGLAPENLMGRRLHEVFPGHGEIVRRVIESGEPAAAFGQPLYYAETETHWDYSISPLRDAQGQVLGAMILCFEVSDRVAAERELDRQRRLTQSLIGHVPAGIAYLDLDLVVRWANPECMRLYQRSAEQLLDRPFLEGASPEAQARFAPILRRVIETGEPFRATGVPYTLRFSETPRVTYWDFSYVPVFGPDRRAEGILVFSLEVSDRVEKERHQRQREQEFRALAESNPDVIARFDRALRHVYINSAVERLTGRSPAEFSGRGHLELGVSEGLAAQWNTHIRSVFETGAETEMEFSFESLVGSVHFHCRLVPEFDAAGEVEYVLGISRDVTALKRSEEALAHYTRELELANAQLRTADRHKDEFLSVISHELRTPLNFIMGFASILDDEVHGALNTEQHEALRKILTGTDRMLTLVDDLLDLARVQAGSFQLSPETTPYGPLVEEVVASLMPLAARKGIALEVELDVLDPPVLDPQRITQVLTNLVGNAIKFTAEGCIRVRAWAREGWLVTEVVDTGMGIDAADLPRLFTPFQQLDMSVTRQVGGAGLGLAISKAIVDGHGGSVEVESAPGQGSTFRFRLPLTAGAGAPAPA